MATLTGKKINTTYDGLLKTEDNQPISTTKKKVTDGYGNETGLSVDSLGNVDVSDDLNVLGNAVVTGSTTANSFIKTGGTSAQFLKADGSLDSNTYITTSTDTLDSVTDRGNSTTNSITVNGINATTAIVDSLEIQFGLRDQNNSLGANGQVLSSTGTGTDWIDVPVDSVNGETGTVVLDTDDVAEGSTNLYDKTVTITGTGAASVSGTYPNFTVNATDTDTTYSAGAGIDITGTTISNSSPDQTVSITSSGAATVTGTYPNFNVDATDTDTTYSAGSNISIVGTTINNTAPDQTVTLTEGDNVTITGTYPNFTIASNDVVGAVSSVSGGTGISVNSTTGAVVVTNTITNNNQLTNGAGYTTNIGDITGVTAGSGISGGGTSGTVTVSHADTSAQTSVNNSGATVIQDVTLDTYGHVTGLASKTITLADLGYTGATNANYITNNNQLTNGAGYTTNVGDITGVTAGTNLTGGGTSGTVTLNLTATPSVTGINIGNQIQLKESADRADLLEITSVTSGWAGIQLRNSADEGRWSLMTDGSQFGVYDDENSDWSLLFDENGGAVLNYNSAPKLSTTAAGATVSGDLIVSGGDISLSGTNGRIQGVATVSASTDAANKAYVDNTAAALVTGVTTSNGISGGGTSGTVNVTLDTDLRGHAWAIGRDNNDAIIVNTSYIDFYIDSSIDMRLENDGDLHVEGDVIAYSTTISDRRLKDNIKTIDNALDKVEKLRGVEYDWNKGSRKGQHEIGLIAQEVEEVFPFLVREKVKSTGEFENDNTSYKSVDYEKLVGVLIESVKELSAKVKTLEAKLQ
jgi:hypothetical protein